MDIDITELSENEINKLIQDMITNSEYSSDEIIQFVKRECQMISLKPKTLGMLFEIRANVNDDDVHTYFTEEIEIEDLKTNVHPNFQTSNGSDWARSNTSYLGKKYQIKRPKKNGRIFSVRLDGPNNNSVERYRHIRDDIKRTILQQRCRILDIGSNIEVDHKDGRYTNLSNLSLDDQIENDFQPLSKAANDAKRGHCNRCKESGKRYNARLLGYKEGWTVGDENTQNCIGCYWYDPKEFNTRISQSFNKER